MSEALASSEVHRTAALRTLVLNADYRPLTTYPLTMLTARQAVEAVYSDKVVVVENWAECFHSEKVTIQVPKVIALRDYQNINSEPKFCRRSILLRDHFECQYCGDRFSYEELTWDHLIPKSKGGKTTWTNILTACLDCNGLKANKQANYSGRRGVKAADGRLRPLKLPRRPTASELLRAGLEFLPPDVKEDFGSFLYWNVELES